jgi:phospholipid/cholesterol/gamma-HCH transport system substrate-binding protein
MKHSWAGVTVGILTALVLGGAYFIFMYTSEASPGEGYRVFGLFNDALGLHEKSGVRSAGIAVGTIGPREYDYAAKKARVTIFINPNFVLYSNAVVSKRSASLLGEVYLDVDPGSEFDTQAGNQRRNRVLKDGDRIENVIEATNVGEIVDQVNVTLPLLQQILRDVQALTGGPVKEIADNANQMVARNSVVLERLLQKMDNIAGHVEGITRSEADDIKVSVQNIREITEGLKSLVGKTEGEVTGTGQELRSSVHNLEKSINSLQRSMTNVETVTTRLKEGEGTAGRLLADDTIANNIEQITEDAGGFIRGITRLQTLVGLRTEYNYLAGTIKNYFSIKLSPRPDKFYLIEIVDDPRGFRETTQTSIDSSERGLVHENTVKTSLDKLRFSLQFGKRIGAFTGRLGIKESTGGVGADLHFLGDRLTLSIDLFDARSNEYPRVQGRGTWAVYNQNLFLIAGVDDVINQKPTVAGSGAFFDWFFGLQLVIRDQDLRTLLLLGGGALGAASGN